MSDVFRGPYAHSEHAPLFIQKCICPLSCPEHPNGPHADTSDIPEEVKQSVAKPELISSHVTPPAIVPVVIDNALEILQENNVSITEHGESIVITKGSLTLAVPFEIANALCQEILNSKKRIELTLPETLDMTLKTLKQRVGHDMAPLVDMIEKMLKNRHD